MAANNTLNFSHLNTALRGSDGLQGIPGVAELHHGIASVLRPAVEGVNLFNDTVASLPLGGLFVLPIDLTAQFLDGILQKKLPPGPPPPNGSAGTCFTFRFQDNTSVPTVLNMYQANSTYAQDFTSASYIERLDDRSGLFFYYEAPTAEDSFSARLPCQYTQSIRQCLETGGVFLEDKLALTAITDSQVSDLPTGTNCTQPTTWTRPRQCARMRFTGTLGAEGDAPVNTIVLMAEVEDETASAPVIWGTLPDPRELSFDREANTLSLILGGEALATVDCPAPNGNGSAGLWSCIRSSLNRTTAVTWTPVGGNTMITTAIEIGDCGVAATALTYV